MTREIDEKLRNTNAGTLAGEVCNRKMCRGVIAEHQSETGCSCHINPPCSSCTDDRHYCPRCDWSAKDERTEYMNGFIIKVDKSSGVFNSYKLRELDKSKVDYHTFSHTHFSQRHVGVYPEGTTAKEIENLCGGTFGGRFSRFSGGEFEYIAYTD